MSRASALDTPGFLGVDLAGLGATGAAAAAGVEGASTELPHADAIQLAFGRHSIGSVRVEIGGAAAASARAIGAAAYAVGDRIAFASSPDLHTAAHEAAHVVQQRAGVVPRGRGTPGDAYEQHADRVADAVVAGRSAEAILDEVARAGSRGAAASVQCRNEGEAAQLVDAAEYLHHNANEAMEGIRRHLGSVRWPEPHPRLGWRDRWHFFEALVRCLVEFVHGFQQTSSLAKLLYPIEPLAIIDQLRATVGVLEGRPVGPTDWQPRVGLAIGEALAESMLASLARLGPRWLASARRAHGAQGGAFVDVDYAQMVTSHPADRVVGRAMCVPGVFDVRAPRAGEKDDLAGVPDALRPVAVTWQGQRSSRLWNWVKAEPADATAEEVAAQLFGGAGDRGEPASFRAYRLIAAAPYFCVPAEWAIGFDAAKDHAPQAGAREATPAEAYAAVATGPVADEVALAQAGQPGAKADARDAQTSELVTALEDSADVASMIASALEPWELAGPVAGLMAWIDCKRIEVPGMDAVARARWAPVLRGQKANLSRIGGAVVEVTRAASAMGRQAPEVAPLREILETYAHAATTSHLLETSRELIERAARQQVRLPVRALAATRRQLGAALSMHEGAIGPGDQAARGLRDDAYALDQDARALQTRMLAGGVADPAELDELMLSSGELALRARLEAIDAQLGALEAGARASSDGSFARVAALGSPEFLNLAGNCSYIRDRLAWIRQHGARHIQANRAATAVHTDPRESAAIERRYRQEALSAGQDELARLSRSENIVEFLRRGADLLEWQAFRTAVVKMAALIGVSLVGGMLGGVLARGLGGALTRVGASQVVSRVVASGVRLGTETAVSAGGQCAVMGGSFSDAFVENLLANGASAGLSGLFRAARNADEIIELDARTHTFWQRVGGVPALRTAASYTGDIILQTAIGYAARQAASATTEPPPETVKEWLLEGASIAIGRAVGQSIESRRPGLRRLASTGVIPEAERALAAAKTLARKAKAVQKHPESDAALDLLARQHDLLTDELALIDALAKDPARLEAAGVQRAELGPMRRELSAQLDAAHDPKNLELPLHLAGLEELAAGSLWKGSRDQIERAVATLRKTTPDATIHHEDGTTRWRIALGDHSLVINERPPPLGHQLLDGVRALDPAGAERLFRRYSDDEVRDYLLRTPPVTSLAVLERGLAKARERVRDKVDGLHESITGAPEGWDFRSVRTPRGTTGVTDVTTVVRGPDGSEGLFQRGYSPVSRVLHMDYAFLRSPGMRELPGMVPKQVDAPEMIGGRGTPTVHYVTLFQLRELGIPMGSVGSGEGMRAVHMSNIQNLEAIVHLHHLRTTIGGDVSDLIAFTPAMEYAETTVTQAGYQRVGRPEVKGDVRETSPRVVFDRQAGGDPAVIARHDALLARYGFTRDTPMMWGFDIDFPVRPKE